MKKSKLIICGGSDTVQFMPKDIKGEIWGINDTSFALPRVDVIFELHTREVIDQCVRTPEYLKKLQEFKGKIYMQKKYSDIPNSVKFPVEKLVKKHGKHFVSSIDYMIAHALELGFTDIELWGVDLAVYEEYLYQRPSAMYWIGYARGQGANVFVQENSGINWENLYAYENSQEYAMVGLINQVYAVKNDIIKVAEDMSYTDGLMTALSRMIAKNHFDPMSGYKLCEKKKKELARIGKALGKKYNELLEEISEIAGYKTIINDNETDFLKFFNITK